MDGFRFVSADLHLHSVLSACADRSMLPSPILARARELNLQMLAITDHNSVENVTAFQAAAQGTGIHVIPGMEVQTREEVHMICLFDALDQAASWQEVVYSHLPNRKNDERFFGSQWLVDAQGRIVGEHEQLFLVSTDLSVEDVANEVSALGGLCIPAHVDRPAYSIISNLGFVPPDLAVSAVEISQRATPADVRLKYPALAKLGLVADSDAHYLNDMCGRNTFKVKELTVKELELAMTGREGREMWIDGRSV